MTREEVLDRLKQIGTIEDDVQRRELLTEVTEEVSTIYESADTVTKELETSKSEIEKLREANMKLFLKVGEVKSPEEKQKETTGLEKEPEPRRFENLFDEKGMIK